MLNKWYISFHKSPIERCKIVLVRPLNHCRAEYFMSFANLYTNCNILHLERWFQGELTKMIGTWGFSKWVSFLALFWVWKCCKVNWKCSWIHCFAKKRLNGIFFIFEYTYIFRYSLRFISKLKTCISKRYTSPCNRFCSPQTDRIYPSYGQKSSERKTFRCPYQMYTIQLYSHS